MQEKLSKRALKMKKLLSSSMRVTWFNLLILIAL